MSRWRGSRFLGGGAGGGGSPPVTPSQLDVSDRPNQEGSPLAFGAIVAQDSTVAKGLRNANAAVDNNLANPVGVVTQVGGIASLATGTVRTITGLEVDVLLVATLAPAVGDTVILSLVAGRGTIPGSGVSEPVTPNVHVIQRVAEILDVTNYAGASTVLAQIDFGQKSLV